MTATPDAQGYWMAHSDGTVTAFGDAINFGSAHLTPSASTPPVVGLVATPDGMGYWMVFANGGVFTFGDATFYGAAPGLAGLVGITGLTPTADGGGYWLVDKLGQVFSFGDAGSLGDLNGVALNSPVVGMARTTDGLGYWLVTANGNVFSFGDAKFLGSGASQGVTGGVTGIASTPDGQGYWLATASGGVYPFGDANPYPNLAPDALHAPVIAMTAPAQSSLDQVPMQYIFADHFAAGSCPNLPWGMLSAIANVESDFGRSTLPGVTSLTNFAGAAGPMQMGITGAAGETFQAYDHPVPGDTVATVGGANPPNPYNVMDASFAAARDLCSNGGSNMATWRQAVLAYNHSDSYADQVLSLTRAYMQWDNVGGSTAAVALAMTQLGVPYVWGGETPGVAFDCSGLVQWVYSKLGTNLPRTSQAQWAALPHLPPGAAPAPGDLVFFGPSDGPTHVGIVIGNGLMIDAPNTGSVVRIEPYNWSDYLGIATP
jgi:cell wall-associated NlpC family hydrolase